MVPTLTLLKGENALAATIRARKIDAENIVSRSIGYDCTLRSCYKHRTLAVEVIITLLTSSSSGRVMKREITYDQKISKLTYEMKHS